MDNSKLLALLEQAFPNAQVKVSGDGYHHQVVIMDDAFVGLSRVKRSQAVYAVLKPYITSGELHALQIQALTYSEEESATDG